MASVSIVIPVFNEEQSLTELHSQILDKAKYDLKEIIFVNDGSTDNSLEGLKELSKKDPRIKIISFRKNLGKATALNEGLSKSKGDIVVTLDADLQDSPENIPTLIEKLDEGHDMAIGWKKMRQDPLEKTLPSMAFNYFVRLFSKIPLHDFNSGLKVMRKEVAKELNLYGELHRFVPVLAHKQGR